MKLDKTIVFRCSDQEKALLKELAKSNNQTLSEYIKERLFGKKVVMRVNKDEVK